eukprot:g5219.t1
MKKFRCTKCSLNFPDAEAFNIHKEKFCIDSVYADPEKLSRALALEEKKLAARAKGDLGVREMTDFVSGKLNSTKERTNVVGKQLGEKSLAELRTSFFEDDRQSRILLKQMEGQRKRNKADELKALKIRFQQERAEHAASDAELTKMMAELEAEKRRTLKRKMNRRKLQRELADLNRTSLASLEEEKRAELALLSNDVILLKEREDRLKAEVESMQKTIQNEEEDFRKKMKQLEEVELRRASGFGESSTTFTKAQVEAAAEFGERKARLKEKRHQLELQRAGIAKRLGDIEQYRSGVGKEEAAEELKKLVENVSRNIEEDAERIRNMRALAEQKKDISDMLKSPINIKSNAQKKMENDGRKSSTFQRAGQDFLDTKRTISKKEKKRFTTRNQQSQDTLKESTEDLCVTEMDGNDDGTRQPTTRKRARKKLKPSEVRRSDLEDALDKVTAEYDKKLDDTQSFAQKREREIGVKIAQLRKSMQASPNVDIPAQIGKLNAELQQERLQNQIKQQQLLKEKEERLIELHDKGRAASLQDFAEERQEAAEWQTHHVSMANEHGTELSRHAEDMRDHLRALEQHGGGMAGTPASFQIQKMINNHRQRSRVFEDEMKKHTKKLEDIKSMYEKLIRESPEEEELNDALKEKLQKAYMQHQELMRRQQKLVQENTKRAQEQTSEVMQAQMQHQQQQQQQQYMSGGGGAMGGSRMDPMLMQMMMMPMQMMMVQQQMQQQMQQQGFGPGMGGGHAHPSHVEQMRLQHEMEEAALKREKEEMERSRQEFQDSLEALKMTHMGGPGIPGIPGGPRGQGVVPQSAHAQEMMEMMGVVQGLDRDSQLYKMHMAHMEETAKMKFDLKKIEQEKQMREMKADIEKREMERSKTDEYNNWVQEKKMEVKKLRMERQLHAERAALQQQAKTHGSGDLSNLVPYNQQQGFLIYWDFLIAVPAKFTHCRIVYGIFDETEKVKEMVDTPAKECSGWTNATRPGQVQCLIIEKSKRIKLPAKKGTRLIIEVQNCSVLPTGPHNPGRFDSIGWTSMPIFNIAKSLIEGEWQMVLRQPPVSLTKDAESLPALENGMQLCFRIVQGALETSADSMAIDPTVTSHIYKVFNSSVVLEADSAEIARREKEEADALREAELMEIMARREEDRLRREEEEQARQAQEAELGKTQAEADQKEAAKELEAAIAKGIVGGNEIDGEDSGDFGSGRITVKFGTFTIGKDIGKIICKAEIWGGKKIWESKADGVGGFMYASKPIKGENKGSFIMKKFQYQIDQSNDEDKWNLTHLTVDKPPSIVFSVHKAKGYPNEPLVWASFPDIKSVLKKDGELIKLKMFDGPVTKPFKSKDSKRKENRDGGIITVSISQEDGEGKDGSRKKVEENVKEEEEKDKEDKKNEEEEKERKKKETKSSKKKELEKEEEKDKVVDGEVLEEGDYDPDEVVDLINVKRREPPAEEFTSSDGFEIYVDGCRWLPDSCTLCRIKVEVNTSKWSKVGEEHYFNALMDSTASCPTFESRCEYHAGDYVPTSTLLLRVDTIDEVSMDYKCVGYSVLNLFVDKADMESQPTDDNTTEFALNAGAFQLPLYQAPPKSSRDLDVKKAIKKLKRVPSSTVLVRIKQATTNEDGDLVSAKGMTHDEAVEAGITPEIPHYNSRAYDSSLCQPNKAEKLLYATRVERGYGPTIDEILHKAVDDDDVQQSLRDPEELEKWWKNQGNPRGMIDSRFIAKYQESKGFKVAIDGLVNLKESLIYSAGLHTAIYCLCPPGAFYQEPKLTDDVEFLYKPDPDSKQSAPIYLDGFKTFKDIPFDDDMCLLIDVQHIDQGALRRGKHCMRSVGWTALPIFNEHEFVLSDSYILPLYQGQLTEELVAKLSKEDTPEKSLKRMLRKKEIKISREHTGVLCRLIDMQLAQQPGGKEKSLIKVSSRYYKPHYLPEDESIRTKFGIVYEKKKQPAYDRQAMNPSGKSIKQAKVKGQTFEETLRDINLSISEETSINHYNF